MGARAGKDFCHHGWLLPSFLLGIDQGKGGKQEVPHHCPWMPKMARLSIPSGGTSSWEGILNVWPEIALARGMGAPFCVFSVAATIPSYSAGVCVGRGLPREGQPSTAWPTKPSLPWSFPLCRVVKQRVCDRVPKGGTGDSWIRADPLLLINTVPGFLFGLFLFYAVYFICFPSLPPSLPFLLFFLIIMHSLFIINSASEYGTSECES